MKKILLLALAAVLAFPLPVLAQSANAGYSEAQLTPTHVVDTGAVNVLAGSLTFGCPTSLVLGVMVHVLPLHANTTTTPTFNFCGLGAKTITKFGTTALANGDLTTTAIALLLYDGTDMELVNPQTANGTSTISAVNTSAPLGGGGSSGSLTLTCTTCVTSAGSLPSTDLLIGGGSQAAVANVNDQVAAGGIFTLYDNLTTAGLGFPTVLGVSDVTAQSASQTTVNILASTPAAGNYLGSATASAISYTTTYTACTSGTGTYDLHAEVERTN